jgi:protein NirF
VNRPGASVLLRALTLAGVALAASAASVAEPESPCRVRGTGDLGVVIERASGSVLIVDTTARETLARVEGLGDLSHAALVYSRDGRYGYVFGRDGGLSKVDLLCGRLERRVQQAGNSVGGAISQDGRLVAVANYEPGGVRVFDAQSLQMVADLPSAEGDGKGAKVVGLEDAPGQRFAWSLFEDGEVRIADLSDPARPVVQRLPGVGKQPYDALVTPDGRHYVAGLFGEDGLVRIDLWHPERGARRVLDGYGRGETPLPVYKMPHLEGWAVAGDRVFLPAIGHHQVLVVDGRDWKEVGRVPVHGQPVFAVASPDGRQVWVSFAVPDYDTVQVIDTESLQVVHTLKPGKGVMHLEFSPRGEEIWVSVRDEDRVEVYSTRDFRRLAALPAAKPSGIFFTARAHRIGL